MDGDRGDVIVPSGECSSYWQLVDVRFGPLRESWDSCVPILNFGSGIIAAGPALGRAKQTLSPTAAVPAGVGFRFRRGSTYSPQPPPDSATLAGLRPCCGVGDIWRKWRTVAHRPRVRRVGSTPRRMATPGDRGQRRLGRPWANVAGRARRRNRGRRGACASVCASGRTARWKWLESRGFQAAARSFPS